MTGLVDAASVLTWMHQVIRYAPDGMALLDGDLRYVRVNDALARINGIPAQAHVGHTLAELFPHHADLVVPLLRRVLDTGATLARVPVRGETPAQPGVDRSWEVDMYPVGAPNGGRLGVAMHICETTRVLRQRERLAQLQYLSAALAGAASVDRVAAIVTTDTMPDVGAERTNLVVVGHDRLRLLRHTADAVIESALDDDPSPAAGAVRTGQQQMIDAAPHAGVCSLAYPLITASGTIGALEWQWATPAAIDDTRPVLATAASLCAAALDRARLADIRSDLATGFQHSLLPVALPDVAGLELVVRYRASVREAHTGGGWYDAFTRADGSVVLVIGDVVGHSTTSAAVMSELRHSLRTMLFVLGDPAAALTQVDAMLTHLTSEPTVMATVAAVCFASDLTACTYALAGHPPPLVVDPVTGDVTALDAAGALIGAHLGLGYDNAHAQLAPGAVLALFTDGVVERRGEDLDAGTVRMARALELATTGRSLEQAADAVMRAAQQGGINDDMALLLARRPVHDGRDVATEASSDSVVPAAQSSCRRR